MPDDFSRVIARILDTQRPPAQAQGGRPLQNFIGTAEEVTVIDSVVVTKSLIAPPIFGSGRFGIAVFGAITGDVDNLYGSIKYGKGLYGGTHTE